MWLYVLHVRVLVLMLHVKLCSCCIDSSPLRSVWVCACLCIRVYVLSCIRVYVFMLYLRFRCGSTSMLVAWLLHSYRNVYVCVHVVVARHEFGVGARRG